MTEYPNEFPDIDVIVTRDEGFLAVDTTLNGHRGYKPIQVTTEAESVAQDLKRLAKVLYAKAYRDGFNDCKKSIRRALGV